MMATSDAARCCSNGNNNNVTVARRCKVSVGLFHGSFIVLAAVLSISNFVALPVLLQMLLYSASILYTGSHLSLHQNEIDVETGERVNKGEKMNKNDAMLFPVFGSIALLSLYLAYKFLNAEWVNFLLTLYLAVVGVFAFSETLLAVLKPLCNPALSDDSKLQLPLVGILKPLHYLGGVEVSKHRKESASDASEGERPCPGEAIWMWRFGYLHIACYLTGVAVCLLWFLTKHWVLHNVLAIAFCIQAIAIVSVGSFTIAAILLSGLFVYDVFWVFGTEVMVTVAKSFDGPAKLIFPVQLDPWAHSILGLGDIVIPGVFIAMCLRFDQFLCHQQTQTHHQSDVDIHQQFPKFYFWVVLAFYELGLLTTGVVMLAVQRPQPALLYLVPYCLLSLFGAAALNGRVSDVLAYNEGDADEVKTPDRVAAVKKKES